MLKAELQEVDTPALDLEQFKRVISATQYGQLMQAVEQAHRAFGASTIWNVNSTAAGGGVAEMLRSLLAYIRGAGLDTRWLVIPGSPEFFIVTKRIHNHLHGSEGDGGALDEAERRVYESTLAPSALALGERMRVGDVVLLHDPQTAGLIPPLKAKGLHVIWRCHVGLDMPDDRAREAWRFLLPYVTHADATVFSREAFEWEGLDRSKIWIIPPSIDAFSTKNRDMSPEQVDAVLVAAGVLNGRTSTEPRFRRQHGSEARIERRAQMYQARAAGVETPLVVQVSRWDRLKDPAGVLEGFARGVAGRGDAHLVLAGPMVEAVADDPEGKQVLEEAVAAWRSLEPGAKSRVHLACLPMEDSEENAAIVNALQRKARVVVQKSLAEGFGLTVAEAMWKGRPVVASRIGGIQDQIEDGRSGLLLDDPRDLDAYAAAVRGLLDDPERAARIGAAAREEVRDHFLGPRHLIQYARLVADLVEGTADTARGG